MKIVHGVTLLAILALIAGGVLGLSGDVLKWLMVVMVVGFWLEVIAWSAGSSKDTVVKSEESAQAQAKN